ncbi:malonate decarboxylase holo-ACP synthase [Pseudomonas sp. GD04058]|uniref:malonate decarboxylase holo-ACP synthase n=1 Tax=Pseudomonas sp. GD04058 TaxID=2975429 RepID=UPI00244C9AED|nr:malonate decarboxylase holo-ACP synthase [Pseudomonas sp. GD04058]MDG9884255.1 malonate decarboxylase holo-ACP synthase [Pseudomonas sp. GD04058]
MNSTFRAHDLLWGMPPAQLPEDAPNWARQVLGAGLPVVVRRASGEAGSVPVGVRGDQRARRLAAWMTTAAVRCRRRPEDLRLNGPADLPALVALHQVTPILDGTGLDWGPTGGVAYQLATGLTVLHADSDLDLLLRTPTPISRGEARSLGQALKAMACRIDLQLETPNGAVALAEWVTDSTKVLLKHRDGARLVSDPWHLAEQPA